MDRLEAPWPQRTQNAFRPIFTRDDEECDPYEVSRAIIAKVHELRLTPYQSPDPLPPIDLDQVRLICWMAADSG